MVNWAHNDKDLLYKNPKFFWLWFILAQLSFLTTLGLPYQGEEAVYALTSLDMFFNHDWMVPTLYGANYARPPLLNWLIVPLTMVLGWDHVLMVSRLITAGATTLTSILLIGFMQKLFRNRALAAFSALVYMSGDVLFRRGWIAYADALFSLFVFSAIAVLWIAVLEKRIKLLWIVGFSLIAAFLTKAITGYVFYGITLVILGWRYQARAFLLRPLSLVIHSGILLFPLVWNIFFSNGAHTGNMIGDILVKLNFTSFSAYLLNLFIYPINTLLRWLPVSALVVYCLIRRAFIKTPLPALLNEHATTALWILGLNYLPYWLAPEPSHMRYLMPLFPLLAGVTTYILWQFGRSFMKRVFLLLIAGIVLRYIVGIWALPYYQAHYRGNYKMVAQDIITVTHDKPLYVIDNAAVALSVVAYLDVLQMPKAPIHYPPQVWDNGFLISHTLNVAHTKLYKRYTLGRHSLYLLCKGIACGS